MNSTAESTALTMESVLRKLEFPKVLERVAHFAMSEPGRTACSQITPLTSTAAIRSALDEVTAAKAVLIEDHVAPLSGFADVRLHLKKTLVANQGLTPTELLDLALVLRTSRDMHLFLKRRVQQHPALARFLPRLLVDRVVEFNITQALDEQGGIKDSASRELRRIRTDMASSRDALHRRLASILKRVSEQEIAQDDIITTRDGRLVIPIKAEFKGRVPGFIHSSSASGATVFLEPTETLELNNGLRELQLAEQREIIRILADLTAQVGELREPLGIAWEALVELDVLFARAQYSIEIIGLSPLISDHPVIQIDDGRHPVLLQRHSRAEVVPLSMTLGGEETTLVITGPNAGGKTVALKTVGLLTVCAAAGLHIPAGSGTTLFPFRSIFVDIGDDQSLEQDLSTFSSHLVHLNGVLRGSDSSSLVLIDEIGSGTDPDEGGALAMSVLTALRERRTICVATTHQGSLKAFAHSTPGVVNGSMEFDAATLRPTFRFRAGVPGSSYALELAERIGLPPEVLQHARERLGPDRIRLEALLVELERLRQETEVERERLRRELETVERRESDVADKIKALRTELKELRAAAVREARELVSSGVKAIEQAVREVRESAGDMSRIKAARSTVDQLREKLTEEIRETRNIDEPTENIGVGERVRLRDGKEQGELVELDGEKATVLFGTLRLKVDAKNLVRSQPAPASERWAQTAGPSYDVPDASPEVDVRGMTGDEAIATVEQALERAVVAGLHRVDIIHGKGTGALRKRIGEFLKTVPQVRAFRLGEWNEGGAGVTVAELAD